MSRFGFGEIDCSVTPNDPVCLAINGNTTARVSMLPGALKNIFASSGDPIPGQQPVGPGTIVTTSPGAFAQFWAKIPTPVKIGGALLLAFIGYKKFLAK